MTGRTSRTGKPSLGHHANDSRVPAKEPPTDYQESQKGTLRGA